MADDKGDEGELQGNSEFLPFQKADNDDAPFPKDTVEVVALDAEPTVEEAQPTIAETLTATARAAYATASSLVDAVANDTPPPPIDLDETPPPSPVATSSPRKKPAPIMVKELAAAAASVGVTSPEAFRSGGPVANSPPASPKAWQAPPKADSPEARHRTMWKPRSPSIEKPAAPSPEAFRPGGRVRNSPPPSPVPHAGGLGDVFPPRTQKPYEPDDAYDRPGPVPLSNYAAGPRLGPARLPVAVRQAGRAAAWDAAPAPAPAAPAEPDPEPNPRASREEPFNPRASRESLRASRDRDAELQTLRRRVDAAEREAASLRDQARRDRQVKLDAEAEARTLNDELARARALIDQLRDDAVEAAAARGRDAVAVEALQGRVAALEAQQRDADDRVASTAGALERAGLQRRDADHARAEADARAARAEAAAAEARAAVDGWRRAHADLRTAHDALGEEVRRNAAEIARLRSERAAPARESRLRASADLAPPPPPPPVSRPSLAPGSPSKHLAAGPTPLAAFAPAKHAAGYRPPQIGPEPAAPRLAGAPTPFSPRDGAPFATTRDEAHAARRAPLERKLLELNVQRDLLEAESRKAPPHARSYAERRRRTLREERRRDLDAAAARVKAALRDLN